MACEYCELNWNEDAPIVEQTDYADTEGKEYAHNIEVFVTRKNGCGGLFARADLYENTDDVEENEAEVSSHMPINFCPMCGERLTTKTKMTGREIKTLIVSAGLKNYDVAKKYGMARTSFSRKLRDGFTESESEKLLRIIHDMEEEKIMQEWELKERENEQHNHNNE